jgi:hypothetical protein
MGQCRRLFRTEGVYAYYDAGQAQVTIVADVWLNPFTDHCHICPNPIAMPPGALEFLVEGTTQNSGIHPEILVNQRISYAFAASAAPASLVVHSMGLDSPSRQTVAVQTAPPPAFQPATAGPALPTPPSVAAAAAALAPAIPKAATTGTAREVVGYSGSFSFDKALQDALKQAVAKFPPPNPGVAVAIQVTQTYARTKGDIQGGLYLTVVVK